MQHRQRFIDDGKDFHVIKDIEKEKKLSSQDKLEVFQKIEDDIKKVLYANNPQKKKKTEMKRQNYVKHLLNEFGLSQYLRKLYELGYDDNNINKIGLMSRKKFQELVINLKMYPGQSIKMEKLYDYLKQLNLSNTMYNTLLIGCKNKLKNNNNKKQINSELNKRRESKKPI